MSTLTITMPNDAIIRSACTETANQVIAVLAAKFDFPVEEAARVLNLEELKVQRKRGAATKKSVAKKAVRADGKPKSKRKPTGYLMYQASVRAEVTAEMNQELLDEAIERVDEPAKLQPQDVVRRIAELWKAETQDVRDGWNAAAKEANSEESKSEEADSE